MWVDLSTNSIPKAYTQMCIYECTWHQHVSGTKFPPCTLYLQRVWHYYENELCKWNQISKRVKPNLLLKYVNETKYIPCTVYLQRVWQYYENEKCKYNQIHSLHPLQCVALRCIIVKTHPGRHGMPQESARGDRFVCHTFPAGNEHECWKTIAERTCWFKAVDGDGLRLKCSRRQPLITAKYGSAIKGNCGCGAGSHFLHAPQMCFKIVQVEMRAWLSETQLCHHEWCDILRSLWNFWPELCSLLQRQCLFA